MKAILSSEISGKWLKNMIILNSDSQKDPKRTQNLTKLPYLLNHYFLKFFWRFEGLTLSLLNTHSSRSEIFWWFLEFVKLKRNFKFFLKVFLKFFESFENFCKKNLKISRWKFNRAVQITPKWTLVDLAGHVSEKLILTSF